MSTVRRLFEVSLLVAETLAQVRQEQPHLWLPEKQAWDPESPLFVTKVAQFFEKSEQHLGITRATDTLLRQLLQPQFFTTEAHTQLITQIGQIWQPATPQLVGALLLDADNQTLAVDKEQWIQEVTGTSIRYRFAFANWKARNTDVDLKRRGYYLLHAPAGNDMTDGLIIAFASTLPQHYLEIGRVFICSNDRTFDALSATFSKYHIACYRVIQLNRHRLRIHNYQTGETYEYKPPLPNRQEFIRQITELIRDFKKGNFSWRPVIELEKQYEEKYGLAIQEVLQNCASEHASLTAFLRSLPRYCAVHTVQGQAYFCPFLPPEGITLPSTSSAAPQPLAAEMIDIIRELLRSQGKAAGEYAHPGLITTAYNAKYGHGILEGLRRRGLVANLRSFIAQHPRDFAIKSGSNGSWEVAYLASNPPPVSLP